jgi:hypothetical protein
MYGDSWVIKIRPSGAGRAQGRRVGYGESPEGVAEELDYIKGNPHQEILRHAFAVAGIDYGRSDYGVVNNRAQIFEINTNPHLPWADIPTNRAERRDIVLRGLIEAFDSVDVPIAVSGRVRFATPRPRAHNLHWPRRRLPISLGRIVRDLISRR